MFSVIAKTVGEWVAIIINDKICQEFEKQTERLEEDLSEVKDTLIERLSQCSVCMEEKNRSIRRLHERIDELEMITKGGKGGDAKGKDRG